MKSFKANSLLVAALASYTLADPSAGCGCSPSNLQAGTNTLDINGTERLFILTLPSNYDSSTPHRLVFGFHGMTFSAQHTVDERYFGLQDVAAGTNNSIPTIFIAPDGLLDSTFNEQGWENVNGRDIAFVEAMIEATDADLCIDTAQRFSTGFSYGAGMSYSIGCNLAPSFRAVAPLSGAELSGCEGGNDPIAYFGQHGVSDDVLPIADGRELRDRFVGNNGCTEQDPPEPAAGSDERITTRYEGCAEGVPVWWTAFDGDHDPTPTLGGEESYTPGLLWEFITMFE